MIRLDPGDGKQSTHTHQLGESLPAAPLHLFIVAFSSLKPLLQTCHYADSHLFGEELMFSVSLTFPHHCQSSINPELQQNQAVRLQVLLRVSALKLR